jgi:hypothetical protein
MSQWDNLKEYLRAYQQSQKKSHPKREGKEERAPWYARKSWPFVFEANCQRLEEAEKLLIAKILPV